MNNVKQRAIAQARRDSNEFWDDHKWPDILKKYAFVSNKIRDELERLRRLENRGVNLDEEDWEDFYYYEAYSDRFACWIANSELGNFGYELDENERWFLNR